MSEFRARVVKHDVSLRITIPKPIAEALRINEGDKVHCIVEKVHFGREVKRRKIAKTRS